MKLQYNKGFSNLPEKEVAFLWSSFIEDLQNRYPLVNEHNLIELRLIFRFNGKPVVRSKFKDKKNKTNEVVLAPLSLYLTGFDNNSTQRVKDFFYRYYMEDEFIDLTEWGISPTMIEELNDEPIIPGCGIFVCTSYVDGAGALKKDGNIKKKPISAKDTNCTGTSTMVIDLDWKHDPSYDPDEVYYQLDELDIPYSILDSGYGHQLIVLLENKTDLPINTYGIRALSCAFPELAEKDVIDKKCCNPSRQFRPNATMNLKHLIKEEYDQAKPVHYIKHTTERISIDELINALQFMGLTDKMMAEIRQEHHELIESQKVLKENPKKAENPVEEPLNPEEPAKPLALSQQSQNVAKVSGKYKALLPILEHAEWKQKIISIYGQELYEFFFRRIKSPLLRMLVLGPIPNNTNTFVMWYKNFLACKNSFNIDHDFSIEKAQSIINTWAQSSYYGYDNTAELVEKCKIDFKQKLHETKTVSYKTLKKEYAPLFEEGLVTMNDSVRISKRLVNLPWNEMNHKAWCLALQLYINRDINESDYLFNTDDMKALANCSERTFKRIKKELEKYNIIYKTKQTKNGKEAYMLDIYYNKDKGDNKPNGYYYINYNQLEVIEERINKYQGSVTKELLERLYIIIWYKLDSTNFLSKNKLKKEITIGDKEYKLYIKALQEANLITAEDYMPEVKISLRVVE